MLQSYSNNIARDVLRWRVLLRNCCSICLIGLHKLIAIFLKHGIGVREECKVLTIHEDKMSFDGENLG